MSGPTKMPTYAVLGGTGATGSELVKLLVKRGDVHVNVYARSAQKLAQVHPQLSSATNVSTFIGPLSDSSTLIGCLAPASVVFATVATNANMPGCSVAITTVQALLKALESVRTQKQQAGTPWVPPKVVFLSSMTLHPTANHNWLAHKILYNAVYYMYEDVKHATAYLKSEAPWLPLVIACPGALVAGEAQGVRISETEHGSMLHYPDLAAGMVMMAEQEGWEGKHVMLTMEGPEDKSKFLGLLFKYLIPGTITSLIPGAYPWLQWIGWQ